MKIKRFILRRIFNARQREIILAALVFSSHTYKRRSDLEGFAKVSRVIEETENLLLSKRERRTQTAEKTWTESEMKELLKKNDDQHRAKVRGLIETVFTDGIAFGVDLASKGFPQPETFSKEGCESCDNKEECEIYNVVLKEEFEAEEQKQDDTTSASAPVAEEQKQEGE